MRLEEVRQRIITAIEAIVPDHKAHDGDRFVHLDGLPSEESVLPDRTFRVVLITTPTVDPRKLRGTFQTEAPYEATFAVHVIYAYSTHIDQRIAQDADRVLDALRRIETGGQLATINATGAGVTPVLEDTLYVAQWTVTARYDRRDP